MNIIKYIILLIIFFIIIRTIIWLYTFKDPCGQYKCNNNILSDDGFNRIENFLSKDDFNKIQKYYIKNTSPMYNNNTIIIGNPRRNTIKNINDIHIINYLKYKIEKILGIKLYVDYVFLRYYNENAKNLYENYHLDSKHYHHKATQIRALFNIYDKSKEGTFCYKSNCCENGKEYCIKTKENTITFIQANKLLHKYEYKGGERLVYIIDFTTSYKRGLYGMVWGSWDYIWDRIQMYITSISKKTLNIIIIIIVIIIIFFILYFLNYKIKNLKLLKIAKNIFNKNN